jgi:hypothetical protein
MTFRGKDGIISPSSPEGQKIQKTLERQRIAQALNKEQQNMTRLMRQAKTAKEALAIRDKMMKQNPYLGTFRGVVDAKTGRFIQEERKKPKEFVGFARTGPTGEPIGMFLPQTDIIKDGQKVGTMTGSSINTQFSAFKTPIPAQKSTAVFAPAAAKTNTGFLTEKDKAFEFMPEIPQGKGPLARIAAGGLKGTSNIMAGFGNVGVATHNFFTGKDAEPFKFYSTPVTNVEMSASNVVGKGIETMRGTNIREYDPAKEMIKGFGQAGDNFFKDPVGSSASLVEAVPYVVGAGAVKGSKFITNFMGKQKYASALKKSDDILGTGVKPKALDPIKGFFKEKTKTVAPKLQPLVQKKAYSKKDVINYWTGKNYFTPTKSGQVLVQKTKQIQKTKQKPAMAFFPLTKTKVASKQKVSSALKFFPLAKSKSASKTAQRQSARQGTMFGLTPAIIPAMDTPTRPRAAGMRGPMAFFKRRAGGGYYRGQSKGLNRGNKLYVGWNVDPNKAGGFLGGPAYKKSYSAKQIDRDLGIRTKKAATKRKKTKKKTGTEFFNL